VKNRRSPQRPRRCDPGRTRSHQCARLASLPLAGLMLIGLLLATVAASAQDGKYVIKKMPGHAKSAPAGDAASGLATSKKHIGNPKYNDAKLKASRGTASGRAKGRRTYEPITFTKRVDKASPMMSAPSKRTGGVSQGGLLDGNVMGGSASGSPAATGSPVNRGVAPAGRLY
jgi:hypothetical protein